MGAVDGFAAPASSTEADTKTGAAGTTFLVAPAHPHAIHKPGDGCAGTLFEYFECAFSGPHPAPEMVFFYGDEHLSLRSVGFNIAAISGVLCLDLSVDLLLLFFECFNLILDPLLGLSGFLEPEFRRLYHIPQCAIFLAGYEVKTDKKEQNSFTHDRSILWCLQPEKKTCGGISAMATSPSVSVRLHGDQEVTGLYLLAFADENLGHCTGYIG